MHMLGLRNFAGQPRLFGMDWYGWHGPRRRVASNLYELGANENVVQRVLPHAKARVTKDRYIKAFDPASLAAMKNSEPTLGTPKQSAAIVQQASYPTVLNSRKHAAERWPRG